MIHTTPSSGKFRRLVRKLRPMLGEVPVSVELIATGLLERLWHVGISDAFRGDIGKLEDEEIAEMIGWHGDAAELIELLVKEKWLDRHPVHRLLIHDWHEHAPKYVKGNAAKSGGFYTLDGSSPKEPPSDATEHPLGDNTLPYLTKHLSNQLSDEVTRGGIYECKAVDAEAWAAVVPELTTLKSTLIGDRPLLLEDRETLIRGVLVATRYLEHADLKRVHSGAKRLKKASKLDNPFGYFQTCITNACTEKGIEYRRASFAFNIPPEYLNPPRAP